jgi:hypothetical protein
MRSARGAEWILSQVLPPDRAASTIGDWLEDAAERGPVWFWSSVFRTVLARVWSDIAESPDFMVGLALRGWLYSFWLMVGSYFCLFLGGLILVPVLLFAVYVAHQLHWHPLWPDHVITAVVAQIWIGWCEFKTGCWIARHAPGKELAAGIAGCVVPTVFLSALGLLAEHFRGAQINGYLASHPGQPSSLPPTLPSEIFLLAGILWSRNKSLRRIAQ